MFSGTVIGGYWRGVALGAHDTRHMYLYILLFPFLFKINRSPPFYAIEADNFVVLAGNTDELTIEINELIALKNAFTARSCPPDPLPLI